MKNTAHDIIYRLLNGIALIAMATFGMTSCIDEPIYDPTEIPDGATDVRMDVAFMPMSEALTEEEGGSRATVAPPGDGMNVISDMCVLFYDVNDNLVATYSQNDFVDYAEDDMDRTNADVPSQDDGGSGIAAESSTRHASFKLKNVNFGQYKIYVVANLGRWQSGKQTTTTLYELENTYAEAIKTVDGLRSIKLKWDPSNYRNNRQMLGYMTVKGSPADKPMQKLDAPNVILNKKDMELHSWIKRAASKVTITFDATQMRENVRVYLHKSTICDIPLECPLGKDNTVTDEGNLLSTSSHHLDYGEGEDYTKWPSVSRGNPTLDEKIASHDEKAYALYFYENRQGDYTNDPNKERYDKRQWPADDGTVMDSKDKKDNVAFGTYIEVEGYYVSRTSDNVTNGKIIYRFMLGQDIYYNFDATRNCHYKLTLRFRGNANDVDWHIEYGEDFPQIYMPEKYYISYLYNREMRMPVRVTLGESYELLSLRSDIICNNWAPTGANSAPYPDGNGEYQFTWNKGYYNSHSEERNKIYAYINDPDAETPHTEAPNSFDLPRYNTDIEAGFLSMRRTKNMVILEGVTSADKAELDSLSIYWNENNRGWREYDFPVGSGSDSYGSDADGQDGMYTVTRNDSVVVFNIPFYTRAKQLSPWLAYTANNPYPYPRHAVVRFTAEFLDKHTGRRIRKSKRVVIEQVERIENPKGIWRSHDNDAAFNVELTARDPNDLNKFVALTSDGPWRAEVAVGQDWIKLNDKLNNVVQGSSGSKIQFKYQPDGTCGANEVRSGIIRVYYHNYACVHLIFVRQGYASQAIVDNGNKWAVFNLYNKTQLAKSPLSPGSYFRLGNLDDAILEKNNDTYGLGMAISSHYNSTPVYEYDNEVSINNVNSTKQQTKKWSAINSIYRSSDDKNLYMKGKSPSRSKNLFDDLQIGGKKYHVAEYNDYMALLKNCENGYGVLYGDGASGVGKTVEQAFEFKDYANKGDSYSQRKRGMRGVFAYNAKDGRQIFFPISASGHGRRKAWISESEKKKDASDVTRTFYYGGKLRYGDVWNPITDGYRIMVYDLNQTPGAMYYLRKCELKGHVEGGTTYDSYSWDMNYYTYGFGTYHRFNISTSQYRGSDALLLKLIEE